MAINPFGLGRLVAYMIRTAKESDPVRRGLQGFLEVASGEPTSRSLGVKPSYRNTPEEHYVVRRRELDVEVWAEVPPPDLDTIVVASARVAVPPSPELALVHRRGEPATPAPPSLAPGWQEVVTRCGHASIRRDAETVVGRAGWPVEADAVAALVDLVALVARRDGGLTDALLSLPDATALTGHALVPGVVLGLDGLVVGVRRRQTLIAQLDAIDAHPAIATVAAGEVTVEGSVPTTTLALLARAGDGELIASHEGARFTWRAIERDPARLHAAVAALRGLRGDHGPYR
jgi:hypothetical protein